MMGWIQLILLSLIFCILVLGVVFCWPFLRPSKENLHPVSSVISKQIPPPEEPEGYVVREGELPVDETAETVEEKEWLAETRPRGTKWQ